MNLFVGVLTVVALVTALVLMLPSRDIRQRRPAPPEPDSKRRVGMAIRGVSIGDRVRDKITGFQGVVTGYCGYITGCNQALVQPSMPDEKTFVEGRWFDVDRLDVLEPGAVAVESVSSAERPGADMPAPVK